jgi:predicted dehydrogenase
LSGGGLGLFEATRFAMGHKNGLRIEISGDKGALLFDLEDLNAIQFYDATAPGTEQGFRRILVTEAAHPYLSVWWPPGHMLGYEHAFSHQVRDFADAIAAGTQPSPSFAEGFQVQRVLDAVERSANDASAWTSVPAA